MTPGTATDSHRNCAMAPARLGLRPCALRKPGTQDFHALRLDAKPVILQ